MHLEHATFDAFALQAGPEKSAAAFSRRSAWSAYLHAMVDCAADTCWTADATPEPT